MVLVKLRFSLKKKSHLQRVIPQNVCRTMTLLVVNVSVIYETSFDFVMIVNRKDMGNQISSENDIEDP